MKTLNEQIAEVMNGKGSRTTKRIKLIEFGLTPFDVQVIFNSTKATPNYKINNLTFGVEIEAFNFTRDALINAVRSRQIAIESECYNHTDSRHHYKIVSDGSINGNNANEVVSPILKGKKGETSLKLVCDALAEVGADVNKSTGLHIHFDASSISDTHYINIFKNYQKLESAIDTFMPRSRRASNNMFCKSIIGFDFSNCYTKLDIYNVVGRSMACPRYVKVNPDAYRRHKTIEFRQHSGTVEYEKISKWLNFLRKLIEFSFDKCLTENVENIEDIPFLSDTEKQYFINRRSALN